MIFSFNSLLRILEEPNASKSKIAKLCKFLKNDNVYRPLFLSYLAKRLKDNIHPERLLALASNFEQSEITHQLSESINQYLIDKMGRDGENYDQFYFMYRHDNREERNISKTFIKHLVALPTDYSLKIINSVCRNSYFEKYSLIIQMLEYDTDGNRLLHLILSSKLNIEEQYELLLQSLEKCSNTFPVLIESFSGLENIIIDNLAKNGDQDRFAVAIRNSKYPISHLESEYTFNNIILNSINRIPNTIDKLYMQAEQEELWEYLLKLGCNKNKKDLLRSIVKSKDHELIDKFFSLYKNYPEVKHLTPFI